MAKKVIVGGRIESKEVGGIVTGAAEILDDAKGKKQSVINQETDAELERLDGAKQDNLTFDNVPTEGSENPVKSGGLYTAQQAILLAIAAINELIPSAASVLNQLADKAFVNSSISTNTATFRGTSAAGLTEQQFLAWANGLEHDLNDYVFWQTSDAAGNTLFKRYKWNGTEWEYEYTLNNSTFTAEQWEAIQSGITALLVAKLRALPTAQELIQSFDGKQDALTFDDTPTLGSNNPVKSSGIYNVIKAITDLVPAEATAQNQLADKADVAAKIVAAIPSWKGQYDALTDLQAVTGAKAGDMGCVKTTDSDGHAVLTFYQYSAQGAWVVYYTLRHYAQNKPATTGTTGDYPYNGMGRIELQKNIVNGVNTLTQAMLTQQNTIYIIQYDYVLGADITVPANCVLEFDGGSISGESTNCITQNGCKIEGNKCISGIYINAAIELHSSWFSDNVAFKNSLSHLASNSKVYFDSVISLAPGQVQLPDNVSICGVEGHKIMFDDTTALLKPGNNFSIYNCHFDGAGSGKADQTNHREVIRDQDKSNIKIINCTFENLYGGNRMIVIHVDNEDTTNPIKNIDIEGCVFKNYGSYTDDDVSGDPNYISRAIWISGYCQYVNVSNNKFYNQWNVDLSGTEVTTHDADAVCIDCEDTNTTSWDTFAVISDNYFENIYTCPIKTFASYLTVQNNRSIQTKHCNIPICRCYNGRNVQILDNSCVVNTESMDYAIQILRINGVVLANNSCITTSTSIEAVLGLSISTEVIVDGFTFIGKQVNNATADTQYIVGGSLADNITLRNLDISIGRRGAITRFNVSGETSYIINLEDSRIKADYVMRPFNNDRNNLIYKYTNCIINIGSNGDSNFYGTLIAERCIFNFVTTIYGIAILRYCHITGVRTWGSKLEIVDCVSDKYINPLIKIAEDAEVLIDGLICQPKNQTDKFIEVTPSSMIKNIVVKNVELPYNGAVDSAYNDIYYFTEGSGKELIKWGYVASSINNLTRGAYADMPANTVEGFKYRATDNDANGGVYENVYGVIEKVV